ncbi:MAG: glycosyltransferase family 39 protein [Chloroflexi bacterium]|nr:glycosyltransferase family 39 protein [Chloroflexota bacterium]
MTEQSASRAGGWRREAASFCLLVALALAATGQALLLQQQETRGWLLCLASAITLVLAQVLAPGADDVMAGAPHRLMSRRVVTLAVIIAGQAVAMGLARSERALWTSLLAWLVSLVAFITLFLPDEQLRAPLAWLQRRLPDSRLPRWVASPRATTWLAIGGLTLLAAGLRLTNLEHLPNGIHGDETEFGELALAILRGDGPLPFGVAFWGDPALYMHLLAGSVAMVGPNLTALRLISALAGVAMVPAIYLLTRDLFGQRPALIAAALTTISVPLIHFSRLGINVIQGPLFACLSLWCYWRGITSQRALWLAGAGMTAGLALYFSSGSRLVLPVLAVVVGWRLAQRPAAWRGWLREVTLVGVGGLVVLSPLIAAIRDSPRELTGRSETRLIWYDAATWANAANRHGASPGDVPRILLGQVTSGLAAFTHRRDMDDFHPFPGVMLVPALLAPLVLLGLVYAASRARDLRYLIVVAWFAMPFLIGTVLTFNAGSFHRVLPALLPALVVAAVFIDALGRAIRIRLTPHAGTIVASALALAVGLTGGQEALRYISGYGLSYPWAAATLQARYAQSLEPDALLLTAGAPRLYANHSPTRFLAPHVERVDLLNPTVALPAPPRAQAIGIYVPAFNQDWLPLLRAYYPTADVRAHHSVPNETIAYTITLSPADQAAGRPPAGGLRGVVVAGETPPATVQGGRIDPSITFHRLREMVRREQFSGRWAGTLVVSRAGDYEFEIATDGQVTLLLDGQAVVDEQASPGLRTVRGRATLAEGEHAVSLVGRWPRGDGYLDLFWRPPGAPQRALVPPAALRPAG